MERRSAARAAGAIVLVVAVVGGAQSAAAQRDGAGRFVGGPAVVACSHADVPPAPPLSHGRRQHATVLRLRHHPDHRAFTVTRVAATHLGVVALVDGDVDAARRVLGPAVAHVVSARRSDVVEFPPSMKIGVALEGLLQPLGRRVDATVADVPGRAYVALQTHAGGYLVAWKAPVPASIRGLAGVEADGSEVRVVAVRYSQRDVQHASDRLERYLDSERLSWSSISGCDDGGGLLLGIPMDAPDFQATEAELRDAAGMPVAVQGDVQTLAY